jgi:uncharacterized protein (TIGR02145 family)
MTTGYTDSVAAGVLSVAVTPTASSTSDTIRVNGSVVSSGTQYTASASVDTTITIVVKSPNTTTTHTYTVAVVHKSSDTLTTLRTLVVGSGTLSPVFDSLTKTYVDTVASGTTQLVLTPTASSTSDTIRVNGTVVTSGSAYTVTLAADTATVKIVVSNPNTTTVDTYTVAVVRKVSDSIPWNSSISYGSLVDSRDGQVYKTVQVGTQRWMAQNLNYKVDSSWCYDNAADSCLKYGRLYQWASVVGLADSCNTSTCSTQVVSEQQGICPSGWHVPSESEWSTLVQYVDSATSGTVLKSTSGWTSNTGTDIYGFRVLPAGGRGNDGTSTSVGLDANFWSSSESAASDAWRRGLDYGYDGYASVYLRNVGKSVGCSSRCLEN